MPTFAIVILVLFSAVLAGVVVLRPAITANRAGKILAFGVLFFLPLFSLMAGMDNEMERSKRTAFCLSCHIREHYGKSLHVDDPSYLAAAHCQNHRVPADEACYTCHTNYGFFDLTYRPIHKLTIHLGAKFTGSSGSDLRLDPQELIPNQVTGPLNS